MAKPLTAAMDTPRIRQRLKALTKILRHGARRLRVAVRKQLEVSPGGKEFLTGAGQHQGINVFVVIQLRYQVFKRRQALRLPVLAPELSIVTSAV